MSDNKNPDEKQHIWTLTVEEDPETGDLIMPLPVDCLNQVGWDIGDTLIWEDMQNGSWTIRKQDDESSGNSSK